MPPDSEPMTISAADVAPMPPVVRPGSAPISGSGGPGRFELDPANPVARYVAHAGAGLAKLKGDVVLGAALEAWALSADGSAGAPTGPDVHFLGGHPTPVGPPP